ncbi:hypothetical protein CLPU_6c01240 [Gottschalkia purinilytica]|uniref:Uncharacterized protein n=1 Tax=Gottschalkia purinilytica TaxID=1503 RepID=A0A0L0WAW9_GOTPU|nr:hypothetical protein [Gottschalkia purinilytica]KNF08638.1 hypothetical protein CLPU_6c01240 [Gottschalkia purinilytica]
MAVRFHERDTKKSFKNNSVRSIVLRYLSTIKDGNFTIVKQDNQAIQVNLNEKYILGNYLCCK